ncbi:MAG: hypothetical protein FWF08_09335, partial [Oscillospiraceae bacterium]|nr:hypothetical protein [Oscillospiraceae bacterium]
MNIIRTKAVEMKTVPAVAYKMKLPAGGAGIKMLRTDIDAEASAAIDKRSGDTAPYGKYDADMFPAEAFAEAAELTLGLPYSARGNIKVDIAKAGAANVTEEPAEPEKGKDMVESDEYKAIVGLYTDGKGRLNYALMNKDFIQFASKSETVSKMVADKALTDEILLFIVKSRATFISKKKESLDDKAVLALIETLDEINPRSAFK